ncbi:hypothetical protein KUTeg_010268 [Tegillarca granosa]|uniref:Cytochrome P450 n=1 Tax=Tegillarca granosa TaxID=220873 RepID=A0ABQ9F9D5_TEGGR|nr:hypothetical protein KUTeg_010268 [Tegillarca granosa]
METFWLLVATVIVIFVVLLCQKLIKVSQKFSKDLSAFKNVPGLPRHWLFGNVRELAVWSDFLCRMQREFIDEKGVKMYVFWLFNLPIVMVTHPDTAKDIMKSTEPKSLDLLGYGGLLPWLGQSLLISNGTKWERNRRLMTPAFHFDILKPYVEIFNQVADVLMDKMLKAARESEMRTILIHPHHYYDTIYRWSSDGQELYKLCDFVHDFSVKIITERRRKLEESPDVIKKRHLDLLDILLTAKDEEGQGLSDVEIRNEVDTFMFAGHDTTGSLLSWSVYALATYPEHQSKLYEDIHNVLGDRQSVHW